MAKSPINDSGLEYIIPKAIIGWYRCKYEIRNLEKLQKECSRSIEHELDSARESGYTESEIRQLIGDVTIPSWYLIVE